MTATRADALLETTQNALENEMTTEGQGRRADESYDAFRARCLKAARKNATFYAEQAGLAPSTLYRFMLKYF